MDVRKNTTLGNGDRAEKLVQFLIVSHGKLNVSRDNSGLLVVSRGVTSELEDLGGEVLKDGGKVHRSTGTDAGGVLAFLQESADSADRELETSLGRS